MFSWWSLLYINTFYSTQLFCNGKRKPRSDCTDAQSDLVLRCPHIFLRRYTFIWCGSFVTVTAQLTIFFLIFNKIFISNPLFTCVESVEVLKPLKFIKTKNNKRKWLAIHIWKRNTFHTDKKSDYQNMVFGELLHFQGKQQCQNWFCSLLKTDLIWKEHICAPCCKFYLACYALRWIGTLSAAQVQKTLFIPTLDTTIKFVINLTDTKPLLEVMQEHSIQYFKKHMF